jgi:hypothetical protein
MPTERQPAISSPSAFKDMKKFFVSLGVKNTDDIRILQGDIREHFFFMETPPETAHLTLFYYPELPELYIATCKAGAQVPYEKFVEHIHAISKLLPEIEEGIKVHADRLETYGTQSTRYLGIKLQRSSQILEIREPLIREFCRRLESWGVKNAWGFMRTNPKLWYHLIDSYNPHITIGTLPSGMPTPNLDLDIEGFSITVANTRREVTIGSTRLILRS